ncbi:MAG: DNA gyrase inhibitor YacG [Pirellulales bacterium]
MALVTCPTCHAIFDSTTSKTMPFCSQRCRQIDLGRWLNEEIALPFRDGEEAEADPQRSYDDDTHNN